MQFKDYVNEMDGTHVRYAIGLRGEYSVTVWQKGAFPDGAKQSHTGLDRQTAWALTLAYLGEPELLEKIIERDREKVTALEQEMRVQVAKHVAIMSGLLVMIAVHHPEDPRVRLVDLEVTLDGLTNSMNDYAQLTGQQDGLVAHISLHDEIVAQYLQHFPGDREMLGLTRP